MQNIYIVSGEYEQTTYDKTKYNLFYGMYAIHYIISGHGYFNGKRLGKGQGFMCSKGTFCSYYPDKEDPWTYIWIRVEGSDVKQYIDSYASNDYLFNFHSISEFSEICKTLLNINCFTNTDYGMSLFNIMRSFQTNFQQSPVSASDQIVHSVKEYILQNFNTDVSIEYIAEKMYISRASLRNIFYQKEGMSPKSYLIKVRLDQAKRLLKLGLSVKETALNVGYADAFQFSKIFKKHIGCSPSDYVKSLQHE